jgi:hypothetical protein
MSASGWKINVCKLYFCLGACARTICSHPRMERVGSNHILAALALAIATRLHKDVRQTFHLEDIEAAFARLERGTLLQAALAHVVLLVRTSGTRVQGEQVRLQCPQDGMSAGRPHGGVWRLRGQGLLGCDCFLRMAWFLSKSIRRKRLIDLDDHALVLFTFEFPTEIFKSDLPAQTRTIGVLLLINV